MKRTPQGWTAGRNLTAVRSLEARPGPGGSADAHRRDPAGRRAAPPRTAAGSGAPGTAPAACCRSPFRPARGARTCPAAAAAAPAPPLRPAAKAPAPQRPPSRAPAASEPRAAGIAGIRLPAPPGPPPEGAFRPRSPGRQRRAAGRGESPHAGCPPGACALRRPRLAPSLLTRRPAVAGGARAAPCRWVSDLRGKGTGRGKLAVSTRRASPPCLRARCLLAALSAAPVRRSEDFEPPGGGGRLRAALPRAPRVGWTKQHGRQPECLWLRPLCLPRAALHAVGRDLCAARL